MDDEEAGRRRLGDAVHRARMRRREWVRREAFATAAGMSEKTAGQVERGERVQRGTLLRIEHTLGWPTGTVDVLLDGGDVHWSEQGTLVVSPSLPVTWSSASLDEVPDEELFAEVQRRLEASRRAREEMTGGRGIMRRIAWQRDDDARERLAPTEGTLAARVGLSEGQVLRERLDEQAEAPDDEGAEHGA